MPLFSISAISFIKCIGSIITPFPITDTVVSLIIPLGSKDNLNSFSLTTSVWPAL